MKFLISGLKKENFMTLRWNADIHTVQRRSGEYRILNKRGTCLGEIIEEDGSYKIMVYEDYKNNFKTIREIEKIRDVSKEIINKQLEKPKGIYKEKNVVNFLTYRAHRQRIFSRRATTYYPISLRPAA